MPDLQTVNQAVVTEVPQALDPIVDFETFMHGPPMECEIKLSPTTFGTGVLNQSPAFIGFDPGIDERTALDYVTAFRPTKTLLGAPLVSVNETYRTPPGIQITPGLLAQLEAYVAGTTGGNTVVTFQQELNNTWGAWANSNCTNVYTGQTSAWGAWTTGTITIPTSNVTAAGTYLVSPAVIQNAWLNWQQPIRRKESEKERIAREEAEVRAMAEYAEAQKKAAEEAVRVKARAEKILVRHLDEEQKKTLADKGYFDEDVNGKTYRIWRGTHGNIRELDKDKKMEIASLCVQPAGVPTDDAVLAQLLWLRADEKALLRVANRRLLAPARP